MFSGQFSFFRKRLNFISFYEYFILSKLYHSCILIIGFLCFNAVVMGQGRNGKGNSRVLPHYDVTGQPKQIYDEFRQFMNSIDLPYLDVPCAIPVVMSPDSLDATQYQAWIGISAGSYVFILLKTQFPKEFRDYDATNNFKKAAEGETECTVVFFKNTILKGKNEKDLRYSQSVTYAKMEMDIPKFSAYIKNFQDALSKYEKVIHVPYTFLFHFKNKSSAIHLQAFAPNSRFLKKHDKTKMLWTGPENNCIVIDATEGGDCCCQSPPMY